MSCNDKQRKNGGLVDNFLVLCKQYEQLGKYIYVFTERHRVGDVAGSIHTIALMRKQYHEIGEQLKNLGADLEKLC